MMTVTPDQFTAAMAAMGGLITVILTGIAGIWKAGAEVKADVTVLRANLADAMADVAALKGERDRLRKTLEMQTETLAAQSARLTETINALTTITLERDSLVRQVQRLTSENEALAREIVVLRRRLDEYTVTSGGPA